MPHESSTDRTDMLDKNLLKGDVLEALRASPPAEADLRCMLELAFPADVAEILSELEPEQRLVVLRCLSPENAAEVLALAEEDVQRELLLKLLTKTEISGLLNEMAPDEGADLVAMLPDEKSRQALAGVEPEHAEAIRELASFDPETAGGIMTTEFVTVPPDITIGEALQTLKTSLDQESISNIYVVDAENRLVGVLSVRELLEADPATRVSEEMTRKVVNVHLDEDQENASRMIDHYDFTSLPVVDAEGRLRGVITVDDAMDVLEEEAEEDMALLSGSGVVSVRDPVRRHLRFRLPWLLITLAGGFLAAFLLRFFEPTIERAAALVFFMPVMAGMAGNVGIQSSTVLVRAFATGEMTMRLAFPTLLRQILVGMSAGLLCGALTGLLATALTGEPKIGLAVTVSMTIGITSAASVGTLLPIACVKLRIDPAVASGPFVTTLNDLVGLCIYFTVASILLARIAT